VLLNPLDLRKIGVFAHIILFSIYVFGQKGNTFSNTFRAKKKVLPKVLLPLTI